MRLGPVPRELDRPMVKRVIGERKEAITDVSVDNHSKRRKNLYDMIKPICEEHYEVKRHEIGIFPKDRAVMAYHGELYAVNFKNLRTLQYGTDVVVEKQGTVIKLAPFTKGLGLAFIQAEGFVSEYGIALAALSKIKTRINSNQN
jgi:hypothetical protein